MSFLFTFSLPKLPFRNPFSVGSPDDVSEYTDTPTPGESHGGESYRYRRQRDEGPFSPQSRGRHQRQQRLEQYREMQSPVGPPVSRKRKTMMGSFDDSGKDSNGRYEDGTFRPATGFTRTSGRYTDGYDGPYPAAAHDRGRLTEHDIRYPSSRPNGRVEEEEGEGEVGRPMKRRKIGLAESLISTAISVVIVSTAVGYTAYRMWRDGAFSSTPKAIEARGGRVEEVKDEENEEGAGEDGMASKYATIRSTATTTTVSPPPPYREDAMIDLEEDVDAWMRMNRTPTRMGDGAYVYSERGSRSGLPMLSSLAPSSSPVSPRRIGGGGGSVHHLSSSAQNGHRKRASGRGRHSHSYARHGNKVSTTNGGIGAGGGGSGMTSPVRRYLREEAIGKSSSSSGSYPTVATKKKVEARGEDDEEEEEEMLFDAQMAWMSERVKGLIADGQRALGRPIVLATEGASSASARAGAGAGGLSEGEEGGWLTER